MFEYVKGILADKAPTSAVVDIHGIGYLLEIPLSTFNALPDLRESVRLLVHFYVREDIQKLYGFNSAVEREVFRHLLGISKIGPKAAISILSHVTVADLAVAVDSQNSGMLKAVPGVGPKTAQRLVMELKGKLAPSLAGEGSITGGRGTRGAISVSQQDDAFVALVSLGYSELQVQKALTRVREALGEGIAVEERIKKALQVI